MTARRRPRSWSRPETTQGSLGKTEFIAQADSACAEANSSIEQFAAAGQGESEAAQIAQLRQGVIDQIKQLNPPSDTNLDAFLKAMSDEVSAGQKIGLAVQRGEDPTQFETQLDSAKSAGRVRRLRLRLQGVRRSDQLLEHEPEQQQQLAAARARAAAAAPSPRAAPSTGSAGGTSGGGTSGSSGTSGTSGSSGGTGGSSGGVGPG